MKQIKTLTVNGERYQITDPTAARMDDVVERLCPAFRERGPVVQCTPVAGHPLTVVSALDASEEGYTGVTLHRRGKNVIPYPYAHSTKTTNGITFTDHGDGGITINGTATATAYFNLINPGGINLGNDYVSTGSSAKAIKNNYAYSLVNGSEKINLVYQSSGVVFIQVRSGTEIQNVTVYPQIEYGTAVTAYEPYRGNIFAVDFGQTVYGGSYDWGSGVFTDADGNSRKLTPQTVTAQDGTNVLYSDTGDTSVTGRADPSAVIEKLTNAIIALGGNI